jgi:hypothetical protein
MRRILVLCVVVAVLVVGGLVSMLAFKPSPTRAAATQPVASQAVTGHCPREVLPLPADAIARAADQARIQASFLYPRSGPAVVELAWLAKFRLNVWASTQLPCGSLVRSRTVVVDLLFPKMLPSASLSEGVALVSLFRTGYRVWAVDH